MNTSVLRAVYMRNFIAYFSNPTGYVFICLFVALSSVAAFWPNEFFNANLANLDQLNYWFPFIMLVFIPAITMGIWAEERRQGTDELLLTVPAGDFDIVLGKYLAAVTIYTVSLLFSLLTNFLVLQYLGNPDLGLFLGTYVGYWLVGLAMLAIGMVASFLTGNLTVAFVLGVLLNVPLVFLARSDLIFPADVARAIVKGSIGAQFADFGRGLITLASVAYFLTILVSMLYLSMVLIARRHWVRGANWIAMASHYGLRTVALIVVGVSLTVLFHYHDMRGDVTHEKLNTLSPHTTKLLGQLRKDYKEGKIKQPVQVEAFISVDVPDKYVESRLNLLTVLRELDVLGGDLVRVRINETERFTKNASTAKDSYEITPRAVSASERDAVGGKHIFMGVAMKCGIENETLPFIDRGLSPEYELVRSLWAVTRQKRMKIGVLQTDAPLFGTFNMQTGGAGADWPIIDELKKQYDVVRVNPSQPIPVKVPGEKSPKEGTDKSTSEKDNDAEDDGTFDVLLAVQPSAMGPAEMQNFLDAIRAGQPTAIFEDPFPAMVRVPATSVPRQPPQQMMMMMQRQPPPPKGDIKALWRMLGVNFSGDDGVPDPSGMPMGMGMGGGSQADRIVWQNYNPYPRHEWLNAQREFVFVDKGSGSSQPFNRGDEISKPLQQVLFPFPGWIGSLDAAGMKVDALVRTSDESGYTLLSTLMRSPYQPRNDGPSRIRTSKEYVLAAHVTGRPKAENPHGANPHDPLQPEKDASDINVVLVADVDMLSPQLFSIRQQGPDREIGLDFEFDNVTFVLNVIDALAGEERFLDIRSRRPMHRTLTRIRTATEGARKKNAENREEYEEKCKKEIAKEQAKLDKTKKEFSDSIEALQQRVRETDDPEEVKRALAKVMEKQQELSLAVEEGQQRLDDKTKDFENKRDDEIERIETDLKAEILRVQSGNKLCAILLPPILPLLLALIVLIVRRVREQEGVSRDRLR
ncbi:MAG: Gldg family protein [Candidatus Nealsonbacteria bacterium]|nr:Gldg family protein [Candidatus Nealsonbacteria bacterium]